MSVPNRMSDVQLIGHDGPDRRVWPDGIPVPGPGAGEVPVKVLAAGVNPTDINTRVDWYARDEDAEGGDGALGFPRILGADLCGRVVARGDSVAGSAPGTRVICPANRAEPTPDSPTGFVAIGSEYDGAFAEYCCVPITGASGGVGYAAAQLAVLPGDGMTAWCSIAKPAHVAATGATVIDRDSGPGAVAGRMVEADVRTICRHDLTVCGCSHRSGDPFTGHAAILGSVRSVRSSRRSAPCATSAPRRTTCSRANTPANSCSFPRRRLP